MRALSEAEKFERLVQRFEPGSRLLRYWPLTGGVSAQVVALEVEQAGGRAVKFIVRQHGTVDLAHNPQIARDEHELLRIVRSHGVAAPQPFHIDESRELFSNPVLVLEYIDGEADFEPEDLDGYLSQAVAELVKIHSIPGDAAGALLPAQGKGFGERPEQLDESMGEGRIRDALEGAWPLASTNPAVLLHGDYWPGNWLWNEGRLTAVIDWEDARVGDPLSDLGNTRLELLWALGLDAMHRFTELYADSAAIDLTNLPYWDLCAALRPCGRLAGWGLDPADEASMRSGHREFVSQAVEQLSGG